MSQPKISAKGLADFSFASSVRQRSIARNFKYPSQGEGVGRAIYYSAALSAIRSYHRNGSDPGIFADAIQALELKVRSLEGSKKERLKKARAENNIRAIQTYASRFGEAKYKILPSPHLRYRIGSVILTATPDLRVESRGEQFLIKLDLGKKKVKPEIIDLLLYVFYQAAIAEELPIRPQTVMYLEASTGTSYKCPTDSRTLRKTLHQACDAFATVWAGLPEPPLSS